MPRRKSPPRLYLDPQRRQWIIRAGASFVRTGCAQADRHGAESRLAAYLGQKHTPQRGPDPLIADILLTYASEHLPYTATAKNVSYHVEALDQWWGDKRLSDVTARNCRSYAKTKTPAAARRDLETLRAAINYWHREYGPLPSVPVVILPDAPEPRDKWLTRKEADRLLRAAERTEHLKRFILLGLHTGSRRNAILSLTWDRIDFVAGVMMRRGYGETESKTKKTPPVRLGKRILGLLREWRVQKYVVHYNGRKIKSIQRAFERAAKEAGVKASPHTLRHTRATWVMQEGIDVWEASGHLGMSLKTL